MNALHACGLAAALAVALLAGGCGPGQTAVVQQQTAGDAVAAPGSWTELAQRSQRGAVLIRDMGCGSCHTVPGVRAADGKLAPPLNFFSRRTFIAGEIPNTPQNLVRWLKDPPSVEPGTAMPNLGLSDEQARDIAAYLLSLR